MKIQISLPKDRLKIGSGKVFDGTGQLLFEPFTVYGKSDNDAAKAAGNPSRDPEQKFGDTPAGEFTGKLSYEVFTIANRRSFGNPDDTGAIPTILLRPLQGSSQAWRRQLHEGLAVKMGLRVHAGTPSSTGGLRPTHGCPRVEQKPMDEIVKAIKRFGAGNEFPVSIAEIA